MATEGKADFWSTQAYKSVASFVPQKASVVVEWLALGPDDRVLDVGCGDGILIAQFSKTLSHGSGHVHGIDSSPAMIATCRAISIPAHIASFSVVDVAAPPYTLPGTYDKIFSNAALHWILTPSNSGEVFAALRELLIPGGTFAFEMGGFGNVREIRTALRMGVAAHVGLERAVAADPWFFPDEEFMRGVLCPENGWVVEKMELVDRPTQADVGGVKGWVSLFGTPFFAAIEDNKEREECVRRVTEVLEGVCAVPGGGHVLGYTRLRCLARRVETNISSDKQDV